MGNSKSKKSISTPIEVGQTWTDPIVAEVRRAREEVTREWKRDPELFYKKAFQHAKELGLKVAKLKPGFLRNSKNRKENG